MVAQATPNASMDSPASVTGFCCFRINSPHHGMDRATDHTVYATTDAA